VSNAATGFILPLANYKDRTGSRVPEGDYLVRVTDAELTDTKAGDKMVNLYYEIVGGAEAGQTLVDRLVIKDTTLWRAVEFLRAINIPTPKKNISIPFKLIVGKTLVVTVEDGEPFAGRVKSEVRAYALAATKAAPAADLEIADEDEAEEVESVEETEETEGVAEVAEPVKKPAAKKAAAPAPADDDGEEVLDISEEVQL
jgi:hypothetical protein